MKNKTMMLLALLSITLFTCKREEIMNNPVSSDKTLLIGQWDSYESRSAQTAPFVKQIATNLTIAYESGITFLDSGTFKPRYYAGGIWSEGASAAGNYSMQDEQTVILTYFSGTKDELKFEMDLVKLDKEYLWFRQHYFGIEQEYHLQRVH